MNSKVFARLLTVAVLIGAVMVMAPGGRLHSQARTNAVRIAAGTASLSPAETDAGALSLLRTWDAQVTDLVRTSRMQVTTTTEDALVTGRRHERMQQVVRGVRVFGADLTRQVNAFGQAESVFGLYYPDADLDVTPTVPETQARTLLGAAGNGAVTDQSRFELVVYPMNDGTLRLTWTARVVSSQDHLIHRFFLDAKSGQTVASYNDTWSQTPTVGVGTGVLGGARKLGTLQTGSTFQTADTRRPGSSGGTGLPTAANITFDLKGDLFRAASLVSSTHPLNSDIAVDSDNNWTDPAIVDAHAYAGWVYDYYFSVMGRHGLDNHDIEIWSFANPARASNYATQYSLVPQFFDNAFYFDFGNILYGVGFPSNITLGGQTWGNLAGALDVIGHELTHGVTSFSSNLIYQGESGANNEAFSDIIGSSIENYYITSGSGLGQANYLIGEWVIRPGGLRSMGNPLSYGFPDHYTNRYTGLDDNGGVHTNSSIPNLAFYTAIFGGTNRVSGLSVAGVGYSNRQQIEKAFYRGYTQMLTSSSNFSAARAATIQSARDLFGASSPVVTAITQAWTAVGVL